jgi:hypothetical protein
VQNFGSENFGYFDQKNDRSSKSVSSIDFKPILYLRLGQDLSRNTSVVSNLFRGGKFWWRKDFFVAPKKSRFSWKVDFAQNCRGSSQEPSRTRRECPGVFESVQDVILGCLECMWQFRIFDILLGLWIPTRANLELTVQFNREGAIAKFFSVAEYVAGTQKWLVEPSLLLE